MIWIRFGLTILPIWVFKLLRRSSNIMKSTWMLFVKMPASVLLEIAATRKDRDDELIMMVPFQWRKTHRPASLSVDGKTLPSLRYWFCQFAEYHPDF